MRLTDVQYCKYGPRMSDLMTAEDIERRAVEIGKPMKRVCEEAGVAVSTFWRWKTGRVEPTLGVYRRLVAAVAAPPADPPPAPTPAPTPAPATIGEAA